VDDAHRRRSSEGARASRDGAATPVFGRARLQHPAALLRSVTRVRIDYGNRVSDDERLVPPQDTARVCNGCKRTRHLRARGPLRPSHVHSARSSTGAATHVVTRRQAMTRRGSAPLPFRVLRRQAPCARTMEGPLDGRCRERTRSSRPRPAPGPTCDVRRTIPGIGCRVRRSGAQRAGGLCVSGAVALRRVRGPPWRSTRLGEGCDRCVRGGSSTLRGATAPRGERDVRPPPRTTRRRAARAVPARRRSSGDPRTAGRT